jgi:hypothetical protein
MQLTFEPWYSIKDEEESVRALVNSVYRLSEEDTRLTEHLKYLKMYSGKPQSSDLGFYVQKNTQYKKIHQGKEKYRVNYNVIKSVIDTLVSKACLNPPKATLLTDGACIEDRFNSLKLDKAIYMTMKAGKVFENWGVFVKHALIHGDCDVKVIADEKSKKVKYTRVLPVDRYVQTLDAMYGDPLTSYQTSYIAKDVLFAKYPEMKTKLETLYKSENSKLQSQFITQNKIENIKEFSDYVEIVEAWRLSTDEKKPNGRHMIICRYGALLDEQKLDLQDFPFARLSWNKAHVGFYSPGIPEQLESKQSQINMILSFMTEAADKSKSPKLFVHENSPNDKALIVRNNEMAEVIKYTGNQKPEWQTFSGYPATEFERLQWLIRSCYEEVGLNQMSSTGKNILGSGASKVALQEFTSIETDRFQEFGKSLDNFMISLCRQTIRALKDLKDSGLKEIRGEYKGLYQSIKLEDLDLDDADDIEFSIVTSSMLPMSTAARKDFSQDLYNSGIIDKQTHLGLLRLPDLENYNKLELAPRDAFEYQVEKLMCTKDSKYLLVNENTDLQYGLKYVTSLLCQYSMTEDEDSECINLLEQLKIAVAAKLQEFGAVTQALAQQAQLPQSAIGQPVNVNQSVK